MENRKLLNMVNDISPLYIFQFTYSTTNTSSTVYIHMRTYKFTNTSCPVMEKYTHVSDATLPHPPPAQKTLSLLHSWWPALVQHLASTKSNVCQVHTIN